MTPAVIKPVAFPSAEPVRAALDDPEVRAGLLHHALVILARRMVDRPTALRADAAAEAVQETQLRGIQKCTDYDPAFPVRAWLHGIMNHVLSETVRTIRRLPTQELADAAAWEQLATDLAPDAAEVVPDRLDAAAYLSKLPSEQRELLHLRYFQRFNHEEIAARLGISNGTARVRLCRALNAAKAIAGAVPQEDRP